MILLLGKSAHCREPFGSDLLAGTRCAVRFEQGPQLEHVADGNSGLSLIARLDASFTGETWFSAVQEESVVTLFGVPGDYSKTSRDTFTLLNARLGFPRTSGK